MRMRRLLVAIGGEIEMAVPCKSGPRVLGVSFALLASILVHSELGAQTLEEKIAIWESRVQSSTLEEVVATMATETWPQLPLSSPSLADELRSSVVEFEQREGDKAFEDPERAQTYVALHARLRVALAEAGGYYNWLLADMSSRLVIARLSHQLVKDPGSQALVRTLLANLRLPLFTDESFVGLLEEQGVANAQEELAGTAGFKRLEKTFLILGPKGQEGIAGSPQQRQTSSLLRSVDLAPLLMRLLETDLVAQIYLRGALAYLAAGGNLRDIRLDDVRSFNTLLGEARSDFANEYFHIKQLYATHVHTLIQEFSRPVAHCSFYRLAID